MADEHEWNEGRMTTDFTDKKTDPDDNDIIKNELPAAYVTVVIVIIAAIMVFSFVGNLLALISLSRNKQNVYPWFFNLIMSDLIKTLLCMPYSIYIAQSDWFRDPIGFSHGKAHCPFFGYIFNFVVFMGLISNMCVALDRVYATYFPFHYSINQKKFPTQYVVLVTWCTVAVIAGLPFYLQQGKHAKPPFGLIDLQPMCIYDAWNMEVLRKAKLKPWELDVYVSLYYTVLYAFPVIVIVFSTGLVLHKLLPRLIAERKLYENAKKTMIICNSTELREEPAMTTVGLDNMVTSFAASVDQLDVTPVSTPTTARKASKFSIDNLLKLHVASTKHEDKRKTKRRNQWRAIQTMMIVSVSFFVCHLPHIIFWVFYVHVVTPINRHVGSFGISQSRYIAFAFWKTGQILLIYTCSASNVIVYYSRCTLIKESMTEQAGTVLNVIMTPLYILIRNVNR